MPEFIVTKKAQRPARHDGTCFYCQQPIGSPHKQECVLIGKKALVRVTIEYEVEVPADWSKDQVEFHRNESSWCKGNLVDELSAYTKNEDNFCLCNAASFEYIKDTSEPYLRE